MPAFSATLYKGGRRIIRITAIAPTTRTATAGPGARYTKQSASGISESENANDSRRKMNRKTLNSATAKPAARTGMSHAGDRQHRFARVGHPDHQAHADDRKQHGEHGDTALGMRRRRRRGNGRPRGAHFTGLFVGVGRHSSLPKWERALDGPERLSSADARILRSQYGCERAVTCIGIRTRRRRTRRRRTTRHRGRWSEWMSWSCSSLRFESSRGAWDMWKRKRRPTVERSLTSARIYLDSDRNSTRSEHHDHGGDIRASRPAPGGGADGIQNLSTLHDHSHAHGAPTITRCEFVGHDVAGRSRRATVGGARCTIWTLDRCPGSPPPQRRTGRRSRCSGSPSQVRPTVSRTGRADRRNRPGKPATTSKAYARGTVRAAHERSASPTRRARRQPDGRRPWRRRHSPRASGRRACHRKPCATPGSVIRGRTRPCTPASHTRPDASRGSSP